MSKPDLRLYTAIKYNGPNELTAINARGSLILKGLKARFPDADANELARQAQKHDVEVEFHDTATLIIDGFAGVFEATAEQAGVA